MCLLCNRSQNLKQTKFKSWVSPKKVILSLLSLSLLPEVSCLFILSSSNSQNRNVSTTEVKPNVSKPKKGKTKQKHNLNPKQTQAQPKISLRPCLEISQGRPASCKRGRGPIATISATENSVLVFLGGGQ